MPGTLPGMDSRVASVRRTLNPSPLSGLVWLNSNRGVPLRFTPGSIRTPLGAGFAAALAAGTAAATA